MAICVMKSDDLQVIVTLHETLSEIGGILPNEEYPKITQITIVGSGLPPNRKLGFHVHQAGNILEGCETMGPHFNPFGHNHGSLNDICAHLGDLGNIETDSNGNIDMIIWGQYIRLEGPFSVVGRGLVIHAHEDDLGVHHNNIESITTGNSGPRILCGIIGRLY